MSIYKIIRPLVFKLNPEASHNFAIDFLRYFPNLISLFASSKNYTNLNQRIFNLNFSNPVGLAAGFDKNAQVIASLQKFGFGFVEVGTVTPKPQVGNEKPRIFRLTEDEAIINRLGFNNFGAEIFLQNIQNSLEKISIPFGINIGKNKDSIGFDDYLFLLEKFYLIAPYITINISSPNTKNLRDLQNKENLSVMLKEISQKREKLFSDYKKYTPIILKIAPDLDLEQQEQISKLVLQNKIDGIIISNTTISRPNFLQSNFSSQSGGLSGKPLFDLSNQILKNLFKLTEKKVVLIASGGISSTQDAYTKIKLGASLVQIYSAFIYQGFAMVERIKKELSELLEKDKVKNISDIVGIEV
jgi:dihydroorotate dehydrogenase